MPSIEYQGMKFTGGKFFIILSLIGTIVGGGWTGYKFYDDYLDMKQELDMIKGEMSMILEEVQLVAGVSTELKNDLKQDLRSMNSDIRHITEIVNDVEDRQKEDNRELLDELKLLEENIDLKINKALNNPLSDMSAKVK